MVERKVRYDWDVVKKIEAFIDTSNKNGQIARRRYRLDVTLNRGNENKIALFIMMNPSNTDAMVADVKIKK